MVDALLLGSQYGFLAGLFAYLVAYAAERTLSFFKYI